MSSTSALRSACARIETDLHGEGAVSEEKVAPGEVIVQVHQRAETPNSMCVVTRIQNSDLSRVQSVVVRG